jgi:hypothetical protein
MTTAAVAGTLNGTFYATGKEATTIDREYAATAEWATANNQNATLVLGNGTYHTWTGFQAAGYGVSVTANGMGKNQTSGTTTGGTTLQLDCPLSTPVVYHAPSPGSNL